jgi:Zn-dependent M16 (insulinase) family peptidase
MVADEQRYIEPQQVSANYALDEADVSRKTHIVLGWLLGKNQDVRDVLRGHLLAMVLLDNSASPLRYVLETTELGTAPSPLCGLQDDFKEMIFAVGLMGSEAESAEDVERLIIDELSRLVREGVDPEHLSAMLHQLELGQREIGGDGYPFGLQLFLRGLPAAIHGGDVVALLDIDNALNELRSELANPRFIPDLIQQWLLDNPHRVRLVLSPDTTLNAALVDAEKARLATIQATLSDTDKQAIVQQAEALEARQAEEDDPEILPKVTQEDIPSDIARFSGRSSYCHHLKTTLSDAGTNGLIYQQIIMDLPTLTAESRVHLPILIGAMTDLGVGKADYLTTQMRQASLTGGISAGMSVSAPIHDPLTAQAKVVLGGKALNRHGLDLANLLQDTLFDVRVDELERLRELIAMWRASSEQSLTSNGHALAMTAAIAHKGRSATWAHQQGGLEGFLRLKALDDRLKNDSELEAFSASLKATHDVLLNAPRQALLIGEGDELLSLMDHLSDHWNKLGGDTKRAGDFELPLAEALAGQAWVTSTRVHFCAQAHDAVPWTHPDSPLLSVLSGVLRNGYLHPNIREKGGAYGGGASYDAESASFKLYSYRDPRLQETFEVFDGALAWLLSDAAKPELVEEAILGVIGAMDKPSSPAGEAKKLFHLDLAGKTYTARMNWRKGVISANLSEIRRVAETYLTEAGKTRAVLTTETGASIATEQLGFTRFEA